MHYTFWLLPGLLLCAANAWAQPATPAVPAPRFDYYTNPAPRHWRGTVGPQPVTMELDSGHWGVSGSYYYDRRARPLSLSTQKPTKQKNKTRLEETFSDESGLFAVTGYFLFDGHLRAQLTGTWHSADGRRTLPVALHETYTDALSYQLQFGSLTRFELDSSFVKPTLDSALFRQCYLHPFLAQNPAAAQRLQRALGMPVPESQLARHLDSLLRSRPEQRPGYSYHGDKYVVYNSNYLFSVMQFEQFTAAEEEGMGMHEWGQSRTYDLRTGRRLLLADLLTPGYMVYLRRWLLQRLKPLWEGNAYYDGVGANGKLPAGGFLATGTGLSFSYDDRDDESLGLPGPYHADRSVEIVIPYETLLPIIRPNSPLTALLQERHLLPRK